MRLERSCSCMGFSWLLVSVLLFIGDVDEADRSVTPVGEVAPGSCVILVSGESFPTPIRGRTYPVSYIHLHTPVLPCFS